MNLRIFLTIIFNSEFDLFEIDNRVVFSCNYLNCGHHLIYDFEYLEQHIQSNHVSKKPEICVTCNKTFWTVELLSAHYTNFHTIPDMLSQNLNLDINETPVPYPKFQSSLCSPTHQNDENESEINFSINCNESERVENYSTTIVKAEPESESINPVEPTDSSSSKQKSIKKNKKKNSYFKYLRVVVLSEGIIYFHWGYNETKLLRLPEKILYHFDNQFTELSIKVMSSEIEKIVNKFKK